MPSHPVTIRTATGRHLDDMIDVEIASFASSDVLFNRRQVRRLIANPRAIVLVAIAEGRVRGWAAGLIRRTNSGLHTSESLRPPSSLRPNSSVSGRVYSLAVHPDTRGLGIGRKLLSNLVKRLLRCGATRISLEVQADNGPAIRLYESVGFSGEKSLPHYYGRGRRGRRMRWNAGS